MKHRSKIEIIADMLQCVVNDSTLSSSRLMFKAFLTYKQTKEYLPFLLHTELIKYDDKDDRTPTFRITNKGLQFLEMYNRLPEFVARPIRFWLTDMSR
ncbi:MAG TPA: winged helix-turn-helix domain-containing protein [Nitrososphaeraceae archaeon]|jgi:predicted transcriptional regulator|nr:winged helix-turn-helix domain-containing protein [Nitrososphaeraceae archaeon]